MDQPFYRDELEQMLRKTSDEFKMYPSIKVWSSIYNDLHPDRKWPSLAVMLLLIVAFSYLGTKNTFPSRSLQSASEFSASNTSIKERRENYHQFSHEYNFGEYNTGGFPKTRFSLHKQYPYLNFLCGDSKISNFEKSIGKKTDEDFLASNSTLAPKKWQASSSSLVLQSKAIISNSTLNNTVNELLPARAAEQNILNFAGEIIHNNKTSLDSYKPDYASEETSMGKPVLNISKEMIDTMNEGKFDFTLKKHKKANNGERFTAAEAESEKAWIEDFVLHHHIKRSKWRSNLSLQYYISPSIGYRILYKNSDFKPSNGLLLRSVDNSLAFNQQAAINSEAGASAIFAIRKNIRLKAGIQLNYNNYITYAHELSHPVQTSVLLNDLHNGSLMSVAYNSNYGNVLGSNFNRLNNKTIQVSIPIAFDYKLLGNDQIKWYLGASFQPSFVSSGNAYLLSSDYKYFVDDPSMIRKWNFNTSVETFASVKMSERFHFNIGPQFRYQMLSTYSKEYTFSEKLYNVGIKLGITKKL